MSNRAIPALVIPAELKPADGRFGSDLVAQVESEQLDTDLS
jgi:hypothetical protein